MQASPESESDDEIAIRRIVEALTQEHDPLVRYAALTRAQAVHDAAAQRMGAERARAVADMHAAGLSYARIAEVIGFTRARAQQLVERADQPRRTDHGGPKVMTQKDDITRFVNNYFSDWPRVASPFAFQMPPNALGANRYKSAEVLARELFENAEFRSLQLGTWLGTQDGKIITAAVEAVAPPPYRQDIELIVEALRLAARLQQKDARDKAIAAGVGLAAVGVLFAAASRS